MQSVNRKIVWAFAGILVAVMLMLLNMWQVAFVALLAAAGYYLAGMRFMDRIREFWQKKHG